MYIIHPYFSTQENEKVLLNTHMQNT